MPKIYERDIQEWLCFILKGKREKVVANVGRLDIIVKDDNLEYVIEVKKFDQYKHSIGQIISYCTALNNPSKNIEQVKIIALFNWKEAPIEKIQACENICKQNGIICWFIDENFLRFLYDIEVNQVMSGKDIKPALYFLDQFVHKRRKLLQREEYQNRMRVGYFDDVNEFIFEDDEKSDSESDEIEHVVKRVKKM